jgi:Flp pilus assembly protein TadG
MVELAFVMIPLLALILAILDFGFALFLRNTFQHAVREGVRYAVTGQAATGTGQDASIKSVVKKQALGFLSSSEDKIHIRYFTPGSLAETANNTAGNIVEVSVEGFAWGWMAPLLHESFPVLEITARSSDLVEASPGGVPPTR